MKIQLTISLLVSDRLETLGRCLSSLKPLMRELDSELIIVYTGKNPDTLALAEKYTSHIIPFTWCKDFSKARNAGLKEARGEWFLYLDDDEWFEDTSELIQFFRSGEYRRYQSAEYIQRNYLDWEGASYSDAYVGRMCRLLPDTRFVYPIHENLKPFPAPCKKLGTFVHHYGYVGKKDSKEQEQKSDRNLPLLLERLRSEPPSDHLYAQLAQEYASIRRYEEAVRYCREGIRLAEKEKQAGPLEIWLRLKLPLYLSFTGDIRLALTEGEKILSSGRLAEVGEMNLAVYLIEFCHRLKEYQKGLRYVELYRERLDHLDRHPEKAMEQNGITETFAGAKARAAETYIKGLYFASENEAYDTMGQILASIPWEDKAQAAAQYRNLEAWKMQYPDQEEKILERYGRLDTDDPYVKLQQAYDAEHQGKMEEAERFWKMSAEGRLAGFQDQLIRMAVRNGFSLEAFLQQIQLEEWDACVQRLAEAVDLPGAHEFYQKISSMLTEYPLLEKRLKQGLLERQLTQGILESSHFKELLADYCESVIADAKMLYREDILKDRQSYLLPVKYKFAVMAREALEYIECGKTAECISILREALYVCPGMSVVVSRLTGCLNEKVKELSQPVSQEFNVLGGQVKQLLAGLMESGQWKEAYPVAGQLVSLLPEDLEVLKMKQEIVGKLAE